ncbi:MAG: peptidylprolyl isomerase [Terricaulis sp.]|jgi:peptidyl-prolyl cis-trans isomerase C
MILPKRAPKKISRKIAIFALALALAGCGLGRDAGQDGAGVTNPIVAATVNGRPIYVEDVRAYAVARGWLQETEDLDANSDAFYIALEELIEVRLFAMEAEARGLDREPDVRRQLENARERVLANSIYEEIDQRSIDPEAIERLYRENTSRLGQGEEIHLRHIQLPTREAADAAKRRLEQGERFEALAFELSTERDTAPDGGDLGFATIADLAASVRQAVERNSVGDLIGPLQLPTGWHIFRIEDRRAVGVPSLETLRPRIIDWLRYQEITQLNERLARDTRIERLREPDETLAPTDEVTAPADAVPERPTPQRPAPDLASPPGEEPPPFPFPMGPSGVSGPPPAAPQPAAPAPEPQTQSPADEPVQ